MSDQFNVGEEVFVKFGDEKAVVSKAETDSSTVTFRDGAEKEIANFHLSRVSWGPKAIKTIRKGSEYYQPEAALFEEFGREIMRLIEADEPLDYNEWGHPASIAKYCLWEGMKVRQELGAPAFAEIERQKQL